MVFLQITSLILQNTSLNYFCENNSVITEQLVTTQSQVESKHQKVRDIVKQLSNLSLQNRMMEKDKSSLEYGQTVTLKQIVELTAKFNASAK